MDGRDLLKNITMDKIIEKLKAIREWLNKIPQDKLLHFIAGAMIVALFALIKPFAAYAWSMGVIAGIVKEWYDGGHGGVKEFRDFLATSIGALAMQVVVWLMLLLW